MLLRWNNLRKIRIKEKFGELYEGYNIKSKSMIVFWMGDLIRKAAIVTAVVYHTEYIWSQGLVLFMSSIFCIIINGYSNARNTKFRKRMDTFNEMILIVLMYHLLLFTMFVPDPETKFTIGYSCGAIVCLGLLIHMTILISGPFMMLKNFLRMKIFIRKANKRTKKYKMAFRAKKFQFRRERGLKRIKRKE